MLHLFVKAAVLHFDSAAFLFKCLKRLFVIIHIHQTLISKKKNYIMEKRKISAELWAEMFQKKVQDLHNVPDFHFMLLCCSSIM